MRDFFVEPRQSAGFHVLFFSQMCSTSRTRVFSCDVLFVRRRVKPAENAAQRKKIHLEIENFICWRTRLPVSL
jgi:hypothetical protein